ncbi:hypothetical protein FF125_09430 [Aureibaculum algae]|uniref:Uncharacterized protein n=1 Tax=Aureibaculum algae TaxID=2584122 RepID=A0A5B7TTG2_9FLAO|nr:hypothetical protein [Aureibaculum algae]QCX38641.1 hypothetical protein FF125_09430 [Aureibaculum algae]
MKTQKALDKLIQADKDHKVMSAFAGVVYNDSVDMKINVIGAMHTSGWLKNRIKPFWTEYNHGTNEWIEKSINRAIANDFDDYAVSALLNCKIQSIIETIKKIGLTFISSRYYDDYKKGKVNVLTFAQKIDKHSSKVISKVIEFGWINETEEIVDVAVMRAMIFETNYELKENQVYGKNYSTYYRRATLPFGNWNLANSEPFELKEEWDIFNNLNSDIKSELIFIE